MRKFASANFKRLPVFLSFVFIAVLALTFQNCGSGFEANNLSSLANLDLQNPPNQPSPQLGLILANATSKQSADLNFRVTLQSAKSAPVLVQYETSDGTALAPNDYLRVSGTITIAPGTTAGLIEVPTMNSTFSTVNKTLRINIVASMGAIVETQTASGQIEVAYEMPKFKKISTGPTHICAITMNDSLVCWGSNAARQLGADNAILKSGIVSLPALTGIKDVQTGWGHTCVVTTQNMVKCWGENFILGSNATERTFVPTEIPNLGPIKSLSSMGSHACVITIDDKVKCWGYRIDPNGTDGTPPEEIVEAAGAKAVSVGYENACVITAQNTVKCWGSNQYGQLGNNSTVTSGVPIDVPGLTGIKFISVGNVATCAVTNAGTVKCWGLIGVPPQAPNLVPTDVAGLTDIVDLQMNLGAACAINSQGVARCWGDNSYGILGGNGGALVTTPIAVAGVANFKSISLSTSFACLHGLDDSVKCWGMPPEGTYYQNFSNMVPSDVAGFSGFISTVGGVDHSCGITNNNTVKCWGLNDMGQLGNNSTNPSNNPVDVVGLNGVVEISVGRKHTCARTLLGEVKCWGDRTGPLLNGSPTVSLIARDQGFIAAKGVEAGYYFTCVLTSEDAVSCWGNSDFGLVPTLVPGLTSIKKIDLGTWGSGCALTLANTLKCWGQANFGQLGQGHPSTTPSQTPVDIVGITDVKQVKYGGYHICVLTNQGAVKCWGYNYSGEIGNNSTETQSIVPVDVVGLANGVVEIESQSGTTCAILADRKVKCWGYNNLSQFGNGLAGDSRVPVEAFSGQKVKSVSLDVRGSRIIDQFGRLRFSGRNASSAYTPTTVYFLKQ